MRNKILIVCDNIEEREQMEQILQSIVEEGGELFFAGKQEEGITILNKERPHILFLDSPLLDDKKRWEHEGTHLIIMRMQGEAPQKGEGYVMKPFKVHEVLEKCRLCLHHDPALYIPPM
jgi:DNA-binding response OmpR family regulator